MITLFLFYYMDFNFSYIKVCMCNTPSIFTFLNTDTRHQCHQDSPYQSSQTASTNNKYGIALFCVILNYLLPVSFNLKKPIENINDNQFKQDVLLHLVMTSRKKNEICKQMSNMNQISFFFKIDTHFLFSAC